MRILENPIESRRPPFAWGWSLTGLPQLPPNTLVSHLAMLGTALAPCRPIGYRGIQEIINPSLAYGFCRAKESTGSDRLHLYPSDTRRDTNIGTTPKGQN